MSNIKELIVVQLAHVDILRKLFPEVTHLRVLTEGEDIVHFELFQRTPLAEEAE